MVNSGMLKQIEAQNVDGIRFKCLNKPENKYFMISDLQHIRWGSLMLTTLHLSYLLQSYSNPAVLLLLMVPDRFLKGLGQTATDKNFFFGVNEFAEPRKSSHRKGHI